MPINYTSDVAAEICRLLTDGVSLSEICRRDGMPVRQTVHEWIVDNRDGFGDRYVRARHAQADRFADEIIEISDDGTNDWIEREGETVIDHEHVQRSRLRVDTRKWLMARMAPTKYGDKVTIAGDAENPVKVVNRIEMVPVEPTPKD